MFLIKLYVPTVIDSIILRIYNHLLICNCEQLKCLNDIAYRYVDTVCVAVWLSGNALASTNVVALRRARLVPGWVTVRETILVFNQTTQVYSVLPSLHG